MNKNNLDNKKINLKTDSQQKIIDVNKKVIDVQKNKKVAINSIDTKTNLNSDKKNLNNQNKITNFNSQIKKIFNNKSSNNNLINQTDLPINLTPKQLTRWIIKNNKPHRNVVKNKPKDYDGALIHLENVNKYVTNGYNNLHILKDVNLKIKEGEFVVIYGPSGSGKTTLLTLISALDRPTTGICHLVDSNTLGLGEHKLTLFRKKYVGYIFQQYGLLNDLTVYDNVKIAANLKNKDSQKIDINQLLDKVGMLKYKNKKASTLSGGQAQRVAICRAVIKNPKILFGDEPTGAVHVDATKQILKIFKDINKVFKTTIVIVTHNDKILQIASRVLKVDSGKIVSDYYNKDIKSVDEIDW